MRGEEGGGGGGGRGEGWFEGGIVNFVAVGLFRGSSAVCAHACVHVCVCVRV